MIRGYFEDQVRRIEDRWSRRASTLEDWRDRRPERVRRLREMLGLMPWPERRDLEVTVVDTLEGPGFVVEKLHYQSIPGLYVTGNLYRPASAEQSLPGVLYVTGHATEYGEEGEPLGSKTAYQHHPAWFARNGYVALIIDTIQLGEIAGVHHGTYRRGRWWWWNRGYTPLGVEVWNSIRALDLLSARPEVDDDRLGVTGRSGGGAYSWFLTALDDRVSASVPTAGITDLRDYLVEGVLAEHCDCMYMTNTYRWDFPLVAALSAPRPTRLVNGDSDPLFPIDGVRRTYRKAREVWTLYGRTAQFDTVVTPAGHEDTGPIRRAAFEFFHRHLGGGPPEPADTARAYFDPTELRVLEEPPQDAINESIDEQFVPPARPPAVPADEAVWSDLEKTWIDDLRNRTFRGWPSSRSPVDASESRVAPSSVQPVDSVRFRDLVLRSHRFTAQDSIDLRLWVLRPSGRPVRAVRMAILDSLGWQEWIGVLRAGLGRERAREAVGPGARAFPWPEADEQGLERLRVRLARGDTALAVFAPRGVGPTRWSQDRPGWEIRRGFTLLGQTRDGMRAWDVRRAVDALVRIGTETGDSDPVARLELAARGTMAGVVLYAGLFEPAVDRMVLDGLPSSHRAGPYLLNVRRVLDLPQAVGLAASRGREVVIHSPEPDAWDWPIRLAGRRWIDGSIELRTAPVSGGTWLPGPSFSASDRVDS